MKNKKGTRYGLPWLEPHTLGRPQWTHSNPERPGEAEEIYEPLRDYLATTVAVYFASQIAFSIPFGGMYTPAGATTSFQKTRFHTNLKQAGQLPNPNKFQIEAMSVQLDPRTAPADAKAWVAQMLVTLTIGDNDKRYVEGQPLFIPGGSSVHLGGTIVQGTATDYLTGITVANGWPTDHNVHVLGEDVSSGAQIIEQGQTFAVTEDPSQDTGDAAYQTLAASQTHLIAGTGVRAFYRLLGHWLRGVQ
jgi:hypothetical protein